MYSAAGLQDCLTHCTHNSNHSRSLNGLLLKERDLGSLACGGFSKLIWLASLTGGWSPEKWMGGSNKAVAAQNLFQVSLTYWGKEGRQHRKLCALLYSLNNEAVQTTHSTQNMSKRLSSCSVFFPFSLALYFLTRDQHFCRRISILGSAQHYQIFKNLNHQ